MSRTLNVLRVDSSGREDQSSTRALTNNLIDALEDRCSEVQVLRLDLATGIPRTETGEAETLLFNLSGHGRFDMSSCARFFAGELEDYDCPEEAIEESLSHFPDF
jgi:hypothetical protein